MRFSVFTHVEHSRYQNQFWGYTPYIREMNIWLKHVKGVEVIGPVKNKISSIETAYDHQYLRFSRIPGINFLTPKKSFVAIFYFPSIVYKIYRAMKRSDHIHLRCPGNIGMIGCFVQILFPSKPKSAKYAGNWDPVAKQPWSYKLQKKILNNTFFTRNMKVLVYGNWPGQSKNILPFFTASFSEKEKTNVEKRFTSPFCFLFVGGLVEGKRPLFAILLVEKLMARGIPVKLELYGEGNLRKELQEYVEQKNLEPFIIFHGNRELKELKEAYKKAHFLILASKSEGWPKAVAEGMFFGCIPLATAVSCVPCMLAPPPDNYQGRNGGVEKITLAKRGVIIQPPERSGVDSQHLVDITAEKITELFKDPEEMKRMSMAAQEWSQEYTLERFEEEIHKLLVLKDVRP